MIEGHDGICHFCGKETESYAGDPGQWPLTFCYGTDSPGKVKKFHVICVVTRLHRLEQLESRIMVT